MELRNFDAVMFFPKTTETEAINPFFCNLSSGKLGMQNQLKMRKNTISWYELGKMVARIGSFKGILHLNTSRCFLHYIQQPRRRAKQQRGKFVQFSFFLPSEI